MYHWHEVILKYTKKEFMQPREREREQIKKITWRRPLNVKGLIVHQLPCKFQKNLCFCLSYSSTTTLRKHQESKPNVGSTNDRFVSLF